MARLTKEIIPTYSVSPTEQGKPIRGRRLNELIDVLNEITTASGTLVANTINPLTGTTVTVGGDITTETALSVGTTATITGATTLTGAVSAGSTLNVTGQSTFIGQVNMNGQVNISGALAAVGGVTFAKSTVTQATNISTGVTLNQYAGVITTVSATTAGLATSTFTVTSSYALANSVITATILNYTGTYVTNGIPILTINNVTAGTFDVKITNAHATNALAGVLKIGFTII